MNDIGPPHGERHIVGHFDGRQHKTLVAYCLRAQFMSSIVAWWTRRSYDGAY